MNTPPRLKLLRNGQKPKTKTSPFEPIPLRAPKGITEATNLLTFCFLYAKVVAAMPTTSDVVTALKQRLAHEQARIAEIKEEMEKLAPQYNRYIDLIEEADQRRERIERIAAVLGPGNFKWALLIPEKGPEKTVFPVKAIESSAHELRENLALWEAVEQFLLVAKEARMADILSFLEAVGIGPASRQAVESSVKTHPEVFQTTKRGAEKHYSLKKKSVS